ncbi:hypothetical protein NEFER03_0735 [Nematocida sp. LUAm3]|nr:hypothetical protein NEFER03_0735 [Nematocida sp. LUAm3]KAI5175194.1 hypothetical protein NEFER02_1155 [Nematocida sp. LUAm2]KAI5178134.1 hypothetical protein NEFER01_1312 [Nematocida sp. LUAm1]
MKQKGKGAEINEEDLFNGSVEHGPVSASISASVSASVNKSVNERVVNGVEHGPVVDRVLGREKEAKQIEEFLKNEGKKDLYVYGNPGIGKTYAIKRIAEGFTGAQAYYSNLLMDDEYTPLIERKSKTIILISDEFEGRIAVKRYMKQKTQLGNLLKKEKRSVNYKNIFISNKKIKEGIFFKPYSKEEIEKILDKKLINPSPVERAIKVKDAVEKADLRVSLTDRLPKSNLQEGAIGQYHLFIQNFLKEKEDSINGIYTQFLKEMKKKNIPIIPKDMLKELLRHYT